MALRRLPGRLLTASGTALLVLAPMSALTAHAAAAHHATWTGGAPLPPAAGTGLHRNEDGEPGVGVTPGGQFWVASDIAPYAADDPRVDPAAGLLSGADVWTSTDGGRTYRWVADPFAQGNQFGLAGEDTDLAVATEKNSAGHYNVYATSLWIGSSSLAWSADDGKTWTVNVLGGVPAQDRPWLAADGPCTVYLAYHQLPTFTPVINTYDVCSGGQLPSTLGTTLDPSHQTDITLSTFPGLTNSFNKLTVDTSPTSPHRHAIYVPFSVCTVEQPNDIVTNATASNCPKGTQYAIAVSTDGGQTFTDHPVVLDPSGVQLVWAATVATDAAGTVYFVWSNEKDSFIDVSHDAGQHWSKPVQLNPPHTAAVYPTVAGGSAGRVDVAWYGTARSGDANDPKVMGKPGAKNGARWAVYLARSTDGGSTFDVRTVTGTIHRGYLCTHGGGCSSDGSRNLLDDFGLAISPTTGLDSIAFTDDQPDGKAGHAFTGYTSEVAPRRPPHGKATVRGRHIAAPPARTTSGSRLPNTGGGPLGAVAGLALLTAGLWLRRQSQSGASSSSGAGAP